MSDPRIREVTYLLAEAISSLHNTARPLFMQAHSEVQDALKLLAELRTEHLNSARLRRLLRAPSSRIRPPRRGEMVDRTMADERALFGAMTALTKWREAGRPPAIDMSICVLVLHQALRSANPAIRRRAAIEARDLTGELPPCA